MSQVEKRLGAKVASYRRAAGLTQEQLADRIRVSTETISRLERGAAIPSLARIEDVAQALGVELPDLFRLRDKETQRDRAIESLLGLLRRRSVADIDLIHDLAARIFKKVPK